VIFPTDDQIRFAERITWRQRIVLRQLATGDWHMSASERADAELYELVSRKLARCYPHTRDSITFLSWSATQAGKIISARLENGSLRAPGPS
jgi:hypothetical protein